MELSSFDADHILLDMSSMHLILSIETDTKDSVIGKMTSKFISLWSVLVQSCYISTE